ncbi:MAG: plastocyanin/azurin family copper-binding protein [Thermoplasmata archaeon]
MNKKMFMVTILAILLVSAIIGFLYYEATPNYNVSILNVSSVYSLNNSTLEKLNINKDVTINHESNTIYDNNSYSTMLIEASPMWYYNKSAPSEFFLLYDTVNPTIILHKGSEIKFILVNMDDMTHNLAIVNYAPPYNYMPYMSMMGNNHDIMMNSPMLNPMNEATHTYNAITIVLKFNTAGTLWYICVYPGHAQVGMYGKIIVV